MLLCCFVLWMPPAGAISSYNNSEARLLSKTSATSRHIYPQKSKARVWLKIPAPAAKTPAPAAMATAATAEGRGAGGGKEGRNPSSWQAIGDVARVLDSNYRKHTPTRLRMLDMFLLFVFSTGVLQVGTYSTTYTEFGQWSQCNARSSDSNL